MKITDAIRGEHAAMRPLLRQVRELTRPGSKIDPNVVALYASALQTSIKAHCSVEEPLLLKKIRRHRAAKKVAQKAMEDHGRVWVLLNKAHVDKDKRALHAATRFALANFTYEEKVVFPIAERVLGQNRLAQLGVEWASARGIKL